MTAREPAIVSGATDERSGAGGARQRPAPGARLDGAGALLLVLLVAATFYYVPRFFFAHDDFGWLYLAKHEWHDVRSLLVAHHGSFTPLANTYFRAMYLLAGLAPWPYYVAHLLMHLAAVVMVLRLAGEALGQRFGAIAAAAFFATTFSHWEAVMWLSGGSNQVMSTCFVLAATLAFSAHLRTGRRHFLGLAASAFVLGLLTKETAVTTPLLLFLYGTLVAGGASGGEIGDGRGDRRARAPAAPAIAGVRRIAASLVPIAAIWIGYLAFQLLGNRFARLIDGGLYPARVGSHVVTNGLRYLYSLAAPDPRAPIVAGHLDALSPVLTRSLSVVATASTWVLPVVVLALLWRGGRAVRFALLWTLASLLPFLPITLEPAARYLYLPSVGAALLVGCAASWARRRLGSRAAVAALTALLAMNWMANRLAGEARLRNAEARRAIVAAVTTALGERPEASTVVLVGVPEKYADACDAVRLFADRDVSCALARDAGDGSEPADRTLVWQYRTQARPGAAAAESARGAREAAPASR
jgi:hypothetical protein